MFSDRFSFYLNSEDVICPDLPLLNSKAKGGTMVMWRSELSPYVKVLETSSAAVLPVLLSIPGLTPSAHISLYLPTHGRDSEFSSALSSLEACILQISEDYSCPIYLRGDCNVNPRNTARATLFQHFLNKLSIFSLDLQHPTHHHFTGDGASDSQLDLLLYSGPPSLAEIHYSVECSLTNPLVQSHHDLINSAFPVHFQPAQLCSGNVSAPRVPNNRVKIKWMVDKIPAYQSLVSPALCSLRERWAYSTDPTSFSILLESTNTAMDMAAQATNPKVDLGKIHRPHCSKHPEIKAAQTLSLHCAQALRSLASSPNPDPAAIEVA